MELYDRVRNSSTAEDTLTRMRLLRPRVSQRCDSYSPDLVDGTHPTVAWNALDVGILHKTYKVIRSGRLRSEGSAILSLSLKCCLCGHRDTSELDHFLPKSIYPEYSVLPTNLVPCCSVCNNLKGDKVSDSLGPLFVHPYSVLFNSTTPFLHVSLSFEPHLSLKYSVQSSSSLPEDLISPLRRQFEFLRLGELYETQAIEEVAEQARGLHELHGIGGASRVADHLARASRSIRARLGINHWKPVALAALAGSLEFCDGGFQEFLVE